LHLPQANLAIFQKEFYYLGSKIFNTLPTEIEDLSDNPRKFKIALNIFCIHTSVYTLDEYFNRQYITDKQYRL